MRFDLTTYVGVAHHVANPTSSLQQILGGYGVHTGAGRFLPVGCGPPGR